MADQVVSTLIVEIEGRPGNLEAMLRKIREELLRTKKESDGLGGALPKLSGDQDRAAKAALAHQQALARLAVAEGDTARGVNILTQALANETSGSTAAVRAQTQLVGLQNKFKAETDGSARSLGGAITKLDSFVGSLQSVAGGFALVGAAQGAYSFAREGASVDAAAKSFDNLAASAGTTGEALLASLNKASAGTVSNADAIQSANTALLLLGSNAATKLPGLLEVARASAQTLGTDTGAVFESLVTGISRGSTELIDNAGITLKAGDAYAAYAASIGKGADQLTAAEKQQALLNGVLQAGQTIIQQTSGGAVSSAQGFQQFEASATNLKNSLAGLAATGLAPVFSALGQVADRASTGATRLQEGVAAISGGIQQQGAAIAASGASYEEYVAQTNAAREAAMAQTEATAAAIPFFGQIAAVIGPTVVANQLLSESEYEAAAAAGAHAQAEAIRAQITQSSAAADVGGYAAASQYAQGQLSAADATYASITANIEAQLQSELLAQKQNELGAAIEAAAASGASAEAAAARIAAQFGNVEAPEVLRLIQLHRELAAARAGAGGPAGGALGTAFGAKSAKDETVAVRAAINARANLRGGVAPKPVRAGGGGGGGTAATAQAQAQREEQKFQEQRLKDAQKIDEQIRANEAKHYEKLLDIQKDFEAKSLAQQRENEVSKRQSRADFYDALTQAEAGGDISAQQTEQLRAAYETAFAESQKLAQEGKQKLAAEYLALKQEQIQAELDFQQKVAAAQEDGNKAEVARLQAIEAMRREARQAELDNLLAGGDTNVAAKDQATADEAARYAEEQGQIGDAAEQAAARKVKATKESQAAIEAETAALRQQADLLTQVNAARLANPGAAGTAPAGGTATPATTPTAPTDGAPATVSDPTAAGLLADVQARLDAQTQQLAALLQAIVQGNAQIVGALNNLKRNPQFQP